MRLGLGLGLPPSGGGGGSPQLTGGISSRPRVGRPAISGVYGLTPTGLVVASVTGTPGASAGSASAGATPTGLVVASRTGTPAASAAAPGGGITFVAAGDIRSISAIGASAADMPAGVQADDVLIMVWSNNPGDPAPVAPSGWTQIGTAQTGSTNANQIRITTFWKRAGASEVDVPLTLDVGITAVISAFRGCTTTGSPINASDHAAGFNDNSLNAATMPDVTTTVANCMVIYAANIGGAHTATWGSDPDLISLTEAYDGQTTVGPTQTLTMAYGIASTATTVGDAVTGSTINGSNRKGVATIALTPA